jgi:hypothetical protein
MRPYQAIDIDAIGPDLMLEIKPRPIIIHRAFCSGKCIRGNDYGPIIKMLPKIVPRGTSWCPDCGYALVWSSRDLSVKNEP